MRTKYKIWSWLILFACSLPLAALPQNDSVCLYFQRGYATWDPSLRDNDKTLNDLIIKLKKVYTDTVSCRIELYMEGNASPDGLTSANTKLTEKRVATIESLLREKIQIPDSLIYITANGIDWKGLDVLVKNDPNCPSQQEILYIIEHTPEWIYDHNNQIVDGRKKQLMDLHGGVPYNYMSEKIFPELRNATITIHCKTTTVPPITEKEKNVGTKADDSTRNSTSDQTSEKGNNIVNSTDQTTTSTLSPDNQTEDRTTTPLHRIALKTNLLYDAILMPSLEAEYRIDERWSVAVEGSVAWWKKDKQHKYYQIATIIPEGRYWFGTKKPWHGHYIGLFAGGSWYDLENGARGYRGEFFTTGISYGYMFPIGRSLSLETGIGVGFLRTVYEEYLPIDGHYVYQQTSRTNWIGPVKLKFAFVWRLWDQNKQGGTR